MWPLYYLATSFSLWFVAPSTAKLSLPKSNQLITFQKPKVVSPETASCNFKCYLSVGQLLTKAWYSTSTCLYVTLWLMCYFVLLQIKVDENGKIIDAKFKTFGCGSAIASSSLATEWVKGKQVLFVYCIIVCTSGRPLRSYIHIYSIFIVYIVHTYHCT